MKMSEFNNLADVAAARAQELGDSPLYTFLETGDDLASEMSFAALDQRARSVAASLQAVSQRFDRYVLVLPPGLEYITAFWSCLYAGVCAVPLYPPMNPKHIGRMLSVMQDCDAKGVITLSSIAGMIKMWLAGQGTDPERFQWLTIDSLPLNQAAAWQRPAFDGSDVAFLQYTSGSTGEPKGVMVTHEGLVHNSGLIASAYQRVLDTSGCDYPNRSVNWLPPYHDLGLIDGLLQPVYSGKQVVLMSPLAFLERPLRWLKAISKCRATTSGGPCFGYELCVRKIADEEAQGLDLSSWVCSYNAAEPIRKDVVARFNEKFGPHGYDRRSLQPVYGLAEATLIVAADCEWGHNYWISVDREALKQHVIVDSEGVAGSDFISHGKPLGDTVIRIVNPDTGTQCCAGEVGEAWLAGRSMAIGYWGKDEVNTQIFKAYIKDAQGEAVEGPFFRSGDLGFLTEDGTFFITGRLKDVIILRGKNHYPQDIEVSVFSAHAGLRKGGAAAFAIDAGDGEKLVIVQEARSGLADEEQTAALLAAREAVVANHGVIPHDILLVEQNNIPKTSSGKIRRFKAREKYLDGSLKRIKALLDVMPASPASVDADLKLQRRIEHKMLSWIAEHTDLDIQQIDKHADFGEFGIDSILIVELLCEVEDVLKIRIPDDAAFNHKTIATMAAFLANHAAQVAREASASADKVERKAQKPASNFVVPSL